MGRNLVTIFMLAVSMLAATTAFAADVYEVTCTSKTCHTKTTVSFGGGRMFDQITGYCARDKKFVNVRWMRSAKAPKPMKIWNPQTGKFTDLYKCPKCGDPFLPIADIHDLKHCPECQNAAVKYTRTIVVD